MDAAERWAAKRQHEVLYGVAWDCADVACPQFTAPHEHVVPDGAACE